MHVLLMCIMAKVGANDFPLSFIHVLAYMIVVLLMYMHDQCLTAHF